MSGGETDVGGGDVDVCVSETGMGGGRRGWWRGKCGWCSRHLRHAPDAIAVVVGAVAVADGVRASPGADGR